MTPIIGFGMPTGFEWIIIFVVVLLLFGARKLPELARGIGKSIGEFKKARSDFEREMNNAILDDEEKKRKAAESKEAK